MTIIYRALDGSTFESRAECEEYERENGYQLLENQVKLFDYEGDEIPLEEILENREYDEVYRMEIANREALDTLEDVFYCDAPWSEWKEVPISFPTTWTYCELIDSWLSPDVVRVLQETLEKVGKRKD